MKKFLIYLTSIVTVVCLGLITYYFIKVDETISIATKEIYCNVGDIFSVDDLGIKITKPTNKTTFNYETGVEELVYDKDKNAYVAKSAGEMEITVKTSNRKYRSFKIAVHIGDGVNVPYYIKNEDGLKKIGDYGLDKSYMLLTDITLSSEFGGIGTQTTGFTGIFDGNGHSISGLTLNGSAVYAGLFTKLDTGSVVKDLSLSKVTITGAYDKVGALAGLCNGAVYNVRIKNVNIENSKSTSVMGGLFGEGSGSSVIGVGVSGLVINQAASTSTASYVGGLIGLFDGEQRDSVIRACYVNDATLDLNNSTISGGLVGQFVVGRKKSSIEQSYASVVYNGTDTANYGAFIGKFETNAYVSSVKNVDTTESIEYENLMLKYLVGNLAVVGKKNFTDTDLIAFDTFYTKHNVSDLSKYISDENQTYFLAGFATEDDLINQSYDSRYNVDATNFIYYEVNGERSYWDTSYVWELHANTLPTLRENADLALSPTGDYFRKNITAEEVAGPDDIPQDNPSTDPTTPSDTLTDGENVFVFTNDIDISNTDFTPTTLTNKTINGQGHTLTIRIAKTIGGDAGLYTVMSNSTIKNLTIIVKGVSAPNAKYLGVVAAQMKNNSSIENVKIVFADDCNFTAIACENFGGVVGLANGGQISGVEVTGLKVNANATIENIGGLIADNSANVNNCKVNAVIYGTNNVAGLIAKNNAQASLTDITGRVDVLSANSFKSAKIAGYVAINAGNVDNISVVVNSVKSLSRQGTVLIAGAIAENTGSFANSVVTGTTVEVLNVGSNLKDIVYIGGLVANNSGTVSDVELYITKVGNLVSQANYYVGGVASSNSGLIIRVVMSANLEGNYVGGIAEYINSNSATVDQVLVGKYAKSNGTVSHNTIKGDKYVAGMVVDFRSGLVVNVQAMSSLTGTAANTRTSLVVLVFPDGATLRNCTVASELYGSGTFYRDTWCDYSSSADQFSGLDGNKTYSAYFNLYMKNADHGIMQSVVIDSAQSNYAKVQSYKGTASAFGIASSYENNDKSSFVKVVNGFKSVTDFEGDVTFVACEAFLFTGRYTKTLTFNVGGEVWSASSRGIQLSFLANL